MRSYREMTPAELAEAQRLYESGLSLRKVSKRIGRSDTVITRALRSAGVAIRPNYIVQRPSLDPAKHAEVQHLYEGGLSLQKIADLMGCSDVHVRHILMARGVSRRKQSPPGRFSPNWTGDGVTYPAMHTRIRKERGPASDYDCVDCGEFAEDWSYDHADPDERTSKVGPYSLKIAHYAPRCTSCHRKFDLPYLTAKPSQLRLPYDAEAIRKLHATGMRFNHMARVLGMGRWHLDRACRELGLPSYSRGRPRKTEAVS